MQVTPWARPLRLPSIFSWDDPSAFAASKHSRSSLSGNERISACGPSISTFVSLSIVERRAGQMGAWLEVLTALVASRMKFPRWLHVLLYHCVVSRESLDWRGDSAESGDLEPVSECCCSFT
jgi:hypothetical protein